MSFWSIVATTLISAASGAWCALNIGNYFENRSIGAGTVSSAWRDGENHAVDHLEDCETGSNDIGRWNEGRIVGDTSRLLERMRELRRIH